MYMASNISEIYKRELEFTGYKKPYYSNVKVFLEFLKNKDCDYREVTYNMYTEFLMGLKSNIKNSSINNYIKGIRHFYSFLFKIGQIKEATLNLIFSVKWLPETKDVSRPYIHLQELKDIIEMSCEFTEWMSNEKIKAALWFMFFTGIRKSEMTTIKREDIDLEKCMATIKVPKATRNRDKIIGKVKFPQAIQPLIKEYFESEPEEKNAFNLSLKQITRWFKDLKDYCERINVTPHTLRRGCAVYMHQQGLSLREIQVLLRHSSLDSTLLYVNPDLDSAMKSYDEKITISI